MTRQAINTSTPISPRIKNSIQAFAVFNQLMSPSMQGNSASVVYNLRELYNNGFENLQLRFYQLRRLIEEFLPDLHAHFKSEGVETHMFASQWFLTIFSAKFSLEVAYRAMDVFMSVLFNNYAFAVFI